LNYDLLTAVLVPNIVGYEATINLN